MNQIQVDVDNLWVYEEEYDIHILDDREYIYTHALPSFLKLLKSYNLRATFMVIGKDLELPAARAFCRYAIRNGHEIGNHTWSHPVHFGCLSKHQKLREITLAHNRITKVCGKAPIGFRGPGYYVDADVVEILEQLGYMYDASVLPGITTWFMHMYAQIRGGENKQKIFGAHYQATGTLLEYPISTLPFLRLPIHTTFGYLLGSLYRWLIVWYLKTKPATLLYLFHVIDFVDLPHVDRTSPVIPLRVPFEARMRFVREILYTIAI